MYEGEGHSHTSEKHSDFVPAGNKSIYGANVLLVNILVTEKLCAVTTPPFSIYTALPHIFGLVWLVS